MHTLYLCSCTKLLSLVILHELCDEKFLNLFNFVVFYLKGKQGKTVSHIFHMYAFMMKTETACQNKAIIYA